MTIQGAMNELINMLKADDIPIYYKGVIEKVIETIDDYIDGKDDYIKRKIEPQTEIEIAKAIVHKMIDDAVIAEDAYPDLRQKMRDAVDEYEPRTERSE